MRYTIPLSEALQFLSLEHPPNMIPVIGSTRTIREKNGDIRRHPKTNEPIVACKCPGTLRHFIAWKPFQDRLMTRNDYYALFQYDDPFDAVGIISGPNKWRCFDFDGCPDEYPMFDLLDALGIDESYEWVIRSGSKHGWHVWFLADDLPVNHPLPRKHPDKDKGIYSAPSKFGDFDHLELRYYGCQTIIPPSIHQSGNQYEFYNGVPSAMPETLNTAHVIDTFFRMTTAAPIIMEYTPRERKGGSPEFISLLNALTPETVFDALEWQYSDDGANYVGECPLHDSHSGTCFRWEKQKGFFHCFHAGCEVSGDLIGMVKLFMRFPKMSQAALWCAERWNPDVKDVFSYNSPPHPAEVTL